MNHATTLSARADSPSMLTATQGVRFSVAAWYILTAIGHFIFVAYILAVFYPPIAQHGTGALAGMHLPSGFIEGDLVGNLAAISHVLIAAVVIGGGPLQLLPSLRKNFPGFHRILGRSYVFACLISATGGLFMVWTRGTVGGLPGHIAISGDGLLIIAFSALAVYHAIGGRIAVHRRWAMRLFMAASAVWFYRIGLMGWVMLTGGVGIDFQTFTGPTVITIYFAQYLLPLAMLEWYFRVQGQASVKEQWLFSVVVVGLTTFMAIGIYSATTNMWLPRI